MIDPIRSRCTIVRVPYPSVDQLHGLFAEIAQREGFSINKIQGDEIIAKAERNLKQCMLSLQLSHEQGLFVGLKMHIDEPEWKMKIKVSLVGSQAPMPVI